jgi:GNAT superfamily N-acetyltransferase
MTTSPSITYEARPQPDDVAFIRAGLSAYNLQHAADDAFQPLTWFVRDSNGAVVGGLLGGAIWHWLYVEILWLSDALRGQGYGSRLLAEAEQTAVARGCVGSHLETMSFQALAFYTRHGYCVYGVLDNFPPGHQKYLLQKRLE